MEYQEELGLNLYDMDFRDYDPAIARWTGIDPVTHHSMSPYMAFDGNPVYWADPSGADSAPNMWLQGFDGVWHHVNGSNFTSVWDSDDPETISAGEAIELLDASFGGSGENVSISGPPGRLTLAMAKAWYQYGNGVNYHISLSSLDLSKVRLSDFDADGFALIDLDGKHFSNDEDALIHGTITLELIQGTNEARVRYNSEIDGRGGMFNFDIKSWDNNYLRNIFTYIGEKFYGSRFGEYTTLRYVGGTPFAIHYSGFVTINK